MTLKQPDARAQFREEVAAFGFRYACHDCAFYDPAARACTHGYPTLEERKLTESSTLAELFCKEFSVF